MSGGVAYVHDPDRSLPALVNPGMVTVERLSDADEALLRSLVAEHRALTGSRRAAMLLAAWDASEFRRVGPPPCDAGAHGAVAGDGGTRRVG